MGSAAHLRTKHRCSARGRALNAGRAALAQCRVRLFIPQESKPHDQCGSEPAGPCRCVAQGIVQLTPSEVKGDEAKCEEGAGRRVSAGQLAMIAEMGAAETASFSHWRPLLDMSWCESSSPCTFAHQRKRSTPTDWAVGPVMECAVAPCIRMQQS